MKSLAVTPEDLKNHVYGNTELKERLQTMTKHQLNILLAGYLKMLSGSELDRVLHKAYGLTAERQKSA